jgi:hypothetical protein
MKSARFAMVLFLWLLASCASKTVVAPASHEPLQLRVIEFADHPDPNTGPLAVLRSEGAWPLELDALLTTLGRSGRMAMVYDMRRQGLKTGATVRLRETTARVVGVTSSAAHLSIRLDADDSTPVDLTVPINGTEVVGSEGNGVRHVFVAVSVLDGATAERIPQVYTTPQAGMEAPVKVSGSAVAMPAGAAANGQTVSVVQVGIDELGNVVSARVAGSRFLTAEEIAAIERAVMAWKFQPASQGGRPIPALTTILVPFSQ